MKEQQSFIRTVLQLAVPVTLQSMLQSSFSIVDQVMIGQLGSVSVAGVGLAGKFITILSVLISSVGAVAGIMIAQYLGQKNRQEVRRSLGINLAVVVVLAGIFLVPALVLPEKIMGLYTRDAQTVAAAAEYLKIVAGTFLPMAGATMLATLFRCMEMASLPLYASILAALMNTGVNYILIFGKLGFPALGARGAAIATLLSQLVNVSVMLLMLMKHRHLLDMPGEKTVRMPRFNWKQYAAMLLPVLVCEFMWSLGENVYAAIYGHLGTQSSAAMILIDPIQGLTIGALCGMSQAAGVLVGKELGAGDRDSAYTTGKKLLLAGLGAAVALSCLVLLLRGAYVRIYQVEEAVKSLTKQILAAFALVAPVKVLNMILGSGILRSGGKTTYVMAIDLTGTWLFGVPLGLLAAFVLKLEVPYVYFILSLEECVRLGMGLVLFRTRRWMQVLQAKDETSTGK